MKYLLILLVLITLANAKQHLFMVNEYDKEIELEAKMISKISNSSVKGKVSVFIPKISLKEKQIYAKYFNLVQRCENANFVYDKQGFSHINCQAKDKLFFTNNYKRLISNTQYYGAFFWNKSRPNIVFVKQRLQQRNIELSDEYQQFIEDLDEL